ncbi:hypothetical protein PYW07_004338 [Mythimna separata]|uniref:Uncharacterized protein n=1 Tax=Mythimna separata TaxID=271217 RepID=A0AAD8DYK0_MYTSE|nr:hypothetical protein PYW07_004338 [Mythimna separata]
MYNTLNAKVLEPQLCLDDIPWIPREEQALRWKHADRPNYDNNIDLKFPYSEVPYLEDYDLVKIPIDPNVLIPHVDYWGEGKVISDEGERGFPSCYNVNSEYQLVSGAPDQNRKIPNRIPVRSKEDCNTSNYVRDNSVFLVTVAAASLTSSSAKDIARIVNSDRGTVVVFGLGDMFRLGDESQGVLELSAELQKKGLIVILNATPSYSFTEVTYYKSRISFISKYKLENDLYNTVASGNYDTAVYMVQRFGEVTSDLLIQELMPRLISAIPRNAISFAYKLWIRDEKDIVRKHFPKSFQNIFNEDAVTIVNQQYQQPLKLSIPKYDQDVNNSVAWGDTYLSDITSGRVIWKVIPVWKCDGIKFKLYNSYRKRFLKLDENVNKNGDRKGLGSNDGNEDEHLFYLEPSVNKGTEVFFIVNQLYGQTLNVAVKEDNVGDRLVLGHDYGEGNTSEIFMWVITAWSSEIAVEPQN